MDIKNAGVIKRIVAGSIDTFIEMVLIFSTIYFFDSGQIIPGILAAVVTLGYIVFQDSMFERQSFGKKIMGIQCYSMVGQRVASFNEVLVRGVVRLFFTLSFSVILDLFAAIVDNDNRRFCDMTAGTIVVEKMNKA